MRLVDVGHGAHSVLGESRCGVVHSVFASAIYLRLESGLIALTRSDVAAGPLHVRCVRLGPHRHGQAVRVTPSTLYVDSVAYDLDAPVWAPPPVDAIALGSGRTTLVAVTATIPAPLLSLGLTSTAVGTDSGDGSAAEALLASALARGDLRAVQGLLAGRGPGLTPAGDDALAGILLLTHHLWPAWARTEIAAAGDGADTGEIAAAFLRWAARGSCIEPVHDLLRAASRRDVTAAHGAVANLGRIGASSGSDLAYGIGAAARWLPDRPTGAGPARSGRRGGVHPQQVGSAPAGVGP